MKDWRGHYYRYSDDILVAVPKTIDLRLIESFISDEVEKLNLVIGSDKTERYSFCYEKGILVSRNLNTNKKKNLNYLGLSFDGRRVLLKHASLAGYQKKIVASVKSAIRYHFKTGKKIPKRKIYERYTRMGKMNYQSYVDRCLGGLNKFGFSPAFVKRQASDYFVHKTLKVLKPIVRQAILRKQSKYK